MTIKRMFDTEEEINDTVYSIRHGSIVENEDVVHPDIRYNFYRTMEDEIHLIDNEVISRFRYKPELKILMEERGCYIIKTIYYKAIDVDCLNKYINLYISLGYSNNSNNEYINKLKEMKEEYRFNANIRLIYFVSEKLINQHRIIDVDNFTILKDIGEYASMKNKSNTNLGATIKLFSVDFVTPKDNTIVNISDDLDIKIPIVKNTDLAEGFYIKIDDTVHRLNKFIGDVGNELKTTVNNVASYAKEKLEKSLNDEVNIKREIRKIAYEKYRNIIDLTKMEIKFKNDLETLKYKNDLDKTSLEHKISLERESLAHKNRLEESKAMREAELFEAKHSAEMELKDLKYADQQTSSAFGFIRDVLRLL